MESTSSRGSRLPLILVILLLVAVVGAGIWLFARPHRDGPAGGGGLQFASLAFNANACASSADLPAQGWDWPQTPATVESWVANRDVARTRVHGWWLWAALNQVASGQPLWRGWCTSTQAFPYQYPPGSDPGGAAAAAASLGGRRTALTVASDPSMNMTGPTYRVPQGACVVGGALRDGPSFANNTDAMVAGVIYNPTAFNSIMNQKLDVKQTLQNAAPQPGGTSSVQLAPGSVVLKPMMWPVQASGYTALPVWDEGKTGSSGYVGFENQKEWKRAVAVTPQPQPGVTAVDATYLYGLTYHNLPFQPVTYKQAPVVPIDRFYAYRPNVASLDPCDKAILDQSAMAVYNRGFQQGDFLILIAMHIMTKEQPNWTFQSVYWSDRPGVGPNAANRPLIPAAKGPWQNYLMASTYGIPEASTGGRPPVWGVHFNPYIELAAGHPVATNCMNCHMRGAFAPNMPSGSPTGNATYLTTANTDDPGAIGILNQRNPIFKDLVMTDFQWSLPFRAANPPPGPVGGKPGPAGGKAR
jgi:hypothetical protein